MCRKEIFVLPLRFVYMFFIKMFKVDLYLFKLVKSLAKRRLPHCFRWKPKIYIGTQPKCLKWWKRDISGETNAHLYDEEQNFYKLFNVSNFWCSLIVLLYIYLASTTISVLSIRRCSFKSVPLMSHLPWRCSVALMSS